MTTLTRRPQAATAASTGSFNRDVISRLPLSVLCFLLLSSFSLLPPLSGCLAARSTDEGTRRSHVNVKTMYGVIRGLRVNSSRPFVKTDSITTAYDVFYGVPYAKPPVGDLRFSAPVSPDPWTEVLDATRKKPSCPQPLYANEMYYVQQDEDCLHLNIFTPYETDNPEARYPVILYIHGGSFESGSGHVYNGKVLCTLGIVVVTINYRLGALGFLTTGDEILPGNYGIRDQVASLEWVKDNIAYFRGDPTRVTLVGHSVGASSVGTLMTVGEARGLFHAVIAQSGSASAMYSCYDHNSSAMFKDYVKRVGVLMGCSTNATTTDFSGDSGGTEYQVLLKIRECLRKVPPYDFIKKRAQFPLYDKMGVEFRPYVDGYLLHETPREAFKYGRFAHVPFVTGIVEREFNFYFELLSQKNDPTFEQYLVRSFNNATNVVDLIKFQYTNWTASTLPKDISYENGEILSDFHMSAPTIQLADLTSVYHDQIYLYYFKHPESYHSIELSYLFGTPFGSDTADELGKVNANNYNSEKDMKLSLFLMKQWRAIASTGKPMAIDGKTEWPRYNRSQRFYLSISHDSIEISRDLKPDRAFFWNEILPRTFPESASPILGNGLTTFDKYPSEILEVDSTDEPSQQNGHLVIVSLTVTTILLAVLVIVLVGWLASLKVKIKQMEKVTKLYSVSHVV